MVHLAHSAPMLREGFFVAFEELLRDVEAVIEEEQDLVLERIEFCQRETSHTCVARIVVAEVTMKLGSDQVGGEHQSTKVSSDIVPVELISRYYNSCSLDEAIDVYETADQ